jgi:hypothetical protein
MSFQNTKNCKGYAQRKPNRPQPQPQVQCKTCARGLECSGDPEIWGKHSEETIIKRESLLNAEEAAKRALQFAIQSAAEKSQREKNRAAIANLLCCDPEIVADLIKHKITDDESIVEFFKEGFFRTSTPSRIFPLCVTRGVESPHIEIRDGSNEQIFANLRMIFGCYSDAFNQFPAEIKKLCNNGYIKLPPGTAIIFSFVSFHKRLVSFLQNGKVVFSLIEIPDTGHFRYFRTEYELSRFKEDPINKLGDAFAGMSERRNANGDAQCSIM